MTNITNLIPPHGGYRKLLSYQSATMVYDFTVEFCKWYVENWTDKTNKTDETNRTDKTDKTKRPPRRQYWSRMSDQMIQAARSGRQNIAEGSQASGTSKKTELKLVGVARASQAELLEDYEDFLRQKGLKLWSKIEPQAKAARELAYKSNRTYETYKSYMSDPEDAANCAICLINQTNYLLDRQLTALEKSFLEEGGFTEKLYKSRSEQRKKQAGNW